MQNTRLHILLLLYLFLSFSCKESKYSKHSFVDNFKKSEVINHSVVQLDKDSYFSRVWKIYHAGNGIIAYDVDDQFLFSFTALNQKKMVSKFGKLGQGPDEILGMVTATSLIDNYTITFFEPNRGVLYKINFEDILNPKLSRKLSVKELGAILTLTPISPDLFVATGAFEEGRYLLLNKSGEVLSYNFDYPRFDNEDHFTNAHKAMAFQGSISVRPDGERFFFVCRKSEVFEIIEVTQDDKLTKKFEFHGEMGDYKAEGDGVNSISAAISRYSKLKFIDSYATQQYIYLLYSDRVIDGGVENPYSANRVFVFDWNGKPVKLFNLDVDVNCIAINESDDNMYAYSNDTEQLLKFDLIWQ